MGPVSTTKDTLLETQVEAALAASRVFVAIVVASTDEVEPVVSVRQLRTLVVLVEHDKLNLAALADRLGVHPSNATRLCDRLVEAGLVRRVQADHDRRQVELTATPTGRSLVERLMDRRRLALERVLAAMPAGERASVAAALRTFAVAGGETDSAGTFLA